MIWFVADTHYGHKNIVCGISQWTDKSGCRNFENQSEHDDWVLALINTNVKAEDELWHLGDWSFGGIQKVSEFRHKIRCQFINIVLGNHDHHVSKFPILFESIQYYKELNVDGIQVVLSHYPFESWNNMGNNNYHLHGHVHGSSRCIEGRYDVGVDGNLDGKFNGLSQNVGLISLEQLIKLLASQTYRHSERNGGNKFGTS